MADQAAATNVSLYGSNAILSSDAPTPAELAMIQKASGVEVRDGDQLVNVEAPGDNPQDPPQDAPEDSQEGEKTPEDAPKEAPEGSDEQLQQKTQQAQKALEAVGKDLQSKGVDIQALFDEVTSTGKLSDASYETLEKAGRTRAEVDTLLAGQAAIQNEFANNVLAYVGGKESFAALTELAPQGTRDAFNRAATAGDLLTAKAILDGLQAQRTLKLGTKNPQLKGTPAKVASTVQGYATRAEMVAAMSDRRYSTDASYRAQVEAKVGASAFFG